MKVCYIIIGYSGSGKTTLAHSLSDFLKGIGKKTIVIDTDEIRENFEYSNNQPPEPSRTQLNIIYLIDAAFFAKQVIFHRILLFLFEFM